MSDEINVISRTQMIIVEPSSSAVSIINAGPPGPVTGAVGPAGPAGANGISIDTKAIRRVFLNTSTFTNTSVYTLFSPTPEADALKLTFVKQSSTTLIVAHLQTTLFYNSSNPRNLFIGLTHDNGATIHDICQKYINNYNVYVDINGIASISGLVAGTYTFQPMFKADNVAMTYSAQFEANRTQLSYSITESKP